MADTWTLAPVLAGRAPEHPERPLVNGVPRRRSAAQVEAQGSTLAGLLGGVGIADGGGVGIDLPHCPERMATGSLVPASRFTDPQARERGIAGRRTETFLRDGCQLHLRDVHDQQQPAKSIVDGCGCGATPEVLRRLTCAGVVPIGDAGMTGGKAQAFARERMADYTPPDLDRLFDAFPMTGSGKARRRELERTHTLDSTVTSGA